MQRRYAARTAGQIATFEPDLAFGVQGVSAGLDALLIVGLILLLLMSFLVEARIIVATNETFGPWPIAFVHTFCRLHKEILPVCPVRPTDGNTVHLAEEVMAGTVDAAFVTLPLRHPELHIEELRRDRLVVCLRRDHPLGAKVPRIRPKCRRWSKVGTASR